MDVVYTRDQIWTWYALCESQLTGTIVHKSWYEKQTWPLYSYFDMLHVYSHCTNVKQKRTITLLSVAHITVCLFFHFVNIKHIYKLHTYVWFLALFPSKSTRTCFFHFEGENLVGYLPTRSTCSVSQQLLWGTIKCKRPNFQTKKTD